MWPALALSTLAALMLVILFWRRDRQRAAQERERSQQAIARLQDENIAVSAQEKIKQQKLFDGMIEGVLLVNGAGRIDFVNLSLKRLLSLTRDLRGQSLREALSRPELDDMLQRVSADGQMIGLELDFPEPVSRCLQINVSVLAGADGRRQGTIFVFHDLTRVKQFEATRREFVANVSHELRTPLSLIKGFVETLLDGTAENAEQTTRYLKIIERHTDRLTFLIEDLLTISRIEVGQVAMNLQSLALREAVARVVEDLQSRAAEKGATVENLVPAGLRAEADADRLEQVLFNLLENAIKYGRHEGRIRIGARTLPDRKVQVSVQDDGPGIPPEARERVFERFYRVDRARARDTGGTGLGLSIVKHIVQAHGGEVWVQSEAGSGCTFFFTLAQPS